MPTKGIHLIKREFTVAGEYHYNRSGPVRWIISHLTRYIHLIIGFMLAIILANILYALIPVLTGFAFNAVLQHDQSGLVHISLILLATILIGGCFDLSARFFPELLGKRFARDARAELYVSLLGKSQTFHNRQRIGDIMARAANDMSQLSNMIAPGSDIIIDSFTSLTVTLVFIGLINPQLLLTPLLFTASFLIALRYYSRKLNPVSDSMRAQFGEMNAGLNEVVTGIEVVKATAQEEQEKSKFERNAHRYRDYFIQNGRIQAWYLPPLLLAIAMVAAFLHGLLLVTHHQLSVGSLVAYMGLMVMLHYPAFNSNWAFSLVQLGIAGASRILAILHEETELDENEDGYTGHMQGDIQFEHVSFSYGGTPILKDISFHARPGETVAIVGQTGAGKSTLTKLVNRIYDADGGRVLVDGIDVRDWSLDALRSQISTIEQDIFLFSRSIRENIAYGLGQKATQESIEQAAKDAQADGFIRSFKEGYETVIGERGVTLSGGQRQRIAIARALLTDPSILILDDSTSAIDSATEDEIQRAIHRLLQGRTTLLITHRLSQIRWADKILVLKRGELVDQGTHDELLERCEMYRRIFAHTDGKKTRPLWNDGASPVHIIQELSPASFQQRKALTGEQDSGKTTGKLVNADER
ncbi:MAG TPA: ABC transporter ATP-binding protein [Ktedonobacteraceae bacterium]|nr:ABC transporter ATP-binding protein [Ktedonobacteraceae bacterium]